MVEHNPYEVLVVSVGDILTELYGENVAKIPQADVEKGVVDWLQKNDAYFYGKQGSIVEGVLETIQAEKSILVLGIVNE